MLIYRKGTPSFPIFSRIPRFSRNPLFLHSAMAKLPWLSGEVGDTGSWWPNWPPACRDVDYTSKHLEKHANCHLESGKKCGLNPPATDLKWQVLVCFCPVSYEVTYSNGHQLWGWSDQRIGGKIYGWKHGEHGEHFPKNGWGFQWNVFSNSGDLHIYRLMVASTQNQRSSRVESNRLFKHTVGVNNTSV